MAGSPQGLYKICGEMLARRKVLGLLQGQMAGIKKVVNLLKRTGASTVLKMQDAGKIKLIEKEHGGVFTRGRKVGRRYQWSKSNPVTTNSSKWSKNRSSALQPLPAGLPALVRGRRAQRKVSTRSFSSCPARASAQGDRSADETSNAPKMRESEGFDMELSESSSDRRSISVPESEDAHKFSEVQTTAPFDCRDTAQGNKAKLDDETTGLVTHPEGRTPARERRRAATVQPIHAQYRRQREIYRNVDTSSYRRKVSFLHEIPNKVLVKAMDRIAVSAMSDNPKTRRHIEKTDAFGYKYAKSKLRLDRHWWVKH